VEDRQIPRLIFELIAAEILCGFDVTGDGKTLTLKCQKVNIYEIAIE
jgi:hypothetical protein